jgi:hypothetical protein
MMRCHWVLMLVVVCSSSSFIVCENKLSLRTSLAVCYLLAIKKQKNDESAYKNETVEQKVFGDKYGTTARAYDVTLSVERTGADNSKQVLLRAEVSGTPEEFKGETVLEQEKRLLKYRIIYAYLAQQAKLRARSFAWLRPDDWTLDINTQVTSLPTNYRETVFTPQLGTRVYLNKYVMTVSAQFSQQEFDELVQKHFVSK